MANWQKALWYAGLALTLSVLSGVFLHLFWPVLFAFTLAFLSHQIIQINRFEKWIRLGGKGSYPKASGIWEEIYYHIYRLKKTEKKRKKKLGKILDQFRQSTEALPDAAVVLGQHDEIEWVNKVAGDVLGLQPGDKGQRLPNLIRYPEFIRYLQTADFSDSITITSPVDKHIILTVRIIPYGEGLRLLLAQDVTQLKKMELMRKDFVANVSHELRTPLTVLTGYLETLTDTYNETSPLLANALQQMHGQTTRMQHLVDGLLLLARLETQQKKADCVNIPALLQQICREGSYLPDQPQRLVLTLEADTHISGDEQELRSAFTNLVSNALKYSPDHTKVNLRWYKTANAVVLVVKDQGEGIAAQDIPRVTERFYRCDVKRSHKITGSGLGLAIVKHVLLRHDAHLQITSQIGLGSCFSCHFPLSRVCGP